MKTVPKMSAEAVLENNRFMIKVYSWMALALTVTGVVAAWVATVPPLIETITGSRWVLFGLFLAELVVVMVMVSTISRISSSTAVWLFMLYSVLNGLTLSVIFLVFTSESIALAFYVTAGTFALMSLVGWVTRTDLTSVGNLLLMALLGLVLASLVNLFFQNETVYWISTYAGILIFTGLIAYDTQKIRQMNVLGNEGSEVDKKEAVLGALTLYLDFINLFLSFLRIFGKKK
jgi:FtsH-binding integral membrane protein